MGKAEDRQARAHARDERQRVVLRVFQSCDEAAVRTLAELATEGVTPTCKAGCSHCCSLEVPTSRAEAEVLAAWLTAERTAAELEQIRERLRAWLAWYRTEYVQLVASGISRVDAFFRHAPSCALLDDNRCGGYPARPITCRNHYVSSPVAECDPATGSGNPDVLLAVPRATSEHVAVLQRLVAQQGSDYLATIHLLPEWLAHLLDVEREPWRDTPRLQL